MSVKKFVSLVLSVFLAALVAQILPLPTLTETEGFRFSPKAIQLVYQDGVPHTDLMGQELMQFDQEQSFLPQCIYHALTGSHYGRQYSFSTLKEAGFNCVHTWEGQRIGSVIEKLREADLQLIYHNPKSKQIEKYANDPNILGWYLDEEPTGSYWGANMQEKFNAFLQRKQAIKEVDQIHPVFVIDVPWITLPATPWWIKWNTAGDISSHDNYPLKPGAKSLSGAKGIPETVSLAASVNNQQKPIWFVAQAFGGKAGNYEWYIPDVDEERAMIYSSIIHGATGIIYFALDSWVTRNGRVIGIAPETTQSYIENPDIRQLAASETQTEKSRQLWDGVVSLNTELEQLKQIILSPTSRQAYQVYVKGESYSDAPVRCLLKEVDGQYTLLTVNLDKKPLQVKYKFFGKPTDFQVLFEENRSITINDDSWEDHYRELGVHVYQFRLE